MVIRLVLYQYNSEVETVELEIVNSIDPVYSTVFLNLFKFGIMLQYKSNITLLLGVTFN